MELKMQVVLFVLCSLALSSQHQDCLKGPSKGILLPSRHLMTWDTFVNTVGGGTWSEIYLLPTETTFPWQTLWYTNYPMVTGDTVYIPYQNSVDDVCITEANSTEATHFTRIPYTKYAIFRDSNVTERRYFSSFPQNYVWAVVCFDITTVVHGVCTGQGYMSLQVPQFPPIQLDWWSIVCDLRKVMGLKLTDPRFRLVAWGEKICS